MIDTGKELLLGILTKVVIRISLNSLLALAGPVGAIEININMAGRFVGAELDAPFQVIADDLLVVVAPRPPASSRTNVRSLIVVRISFWRWKM